MLQNFSRAFAVLVLVFAVLAPAVFSPTTALAEDTKATAIAERSLEAMGGQAAWDATRFIRFNFFGVRLHHWDKQTGRHRYEGQTRDGDSYVVLHNLNSRQGEAYVNGERVTGEDEEKYLKGAYSAWINDTYWLLMPYKLRDPGVHLTYDGEETSGGKTYDKLKLTFEGVGLTPGDTYWAYINRETGLMDRWAYFLQDWEEGKEPTQWEWTDWQDHGDIKLSGTRKNLSDGSERPMGELAVMDELPDAVFTSPAKP